MIPDLSDSDYMKEVTHCLSQSIAHVLQVMPPDPIDFIAHSLLNYRKSHPRVSQAREVINKTNLPRADSVLSHAGSSPQVSTQDRLSQTSKPPPEGSENTVVITENCEKEDVKVYIENFCPNIAFVHQDYTIAISSLKDLFDDDDIG